MSFSCSSCSTPFERAADLARHVRLTHKRDAMLRTCRRCGRACDVSNIGRHEAVCGRSKRRMPGDCERCGTLHDGSYGSGRFCSERCSRGFVTAKNSQNRAETNRKISNSLENHVDVDVLTTLVRTVRTWTELIHRLQDVGMGVCKSRAKRLVNQHDLSTSHFKPSKRWTVDELLSHRPDEPKGHIREALLKTGRKHECVGCGLGLEWNGKKLVLQVDHINGDRFDHRPENLRFLCPNCHSQTDTWTWKNTRRVRRASHV